MSYEIIEAMADTGTTIRAFLTTDEDRATVQAAAVALKINTAVQTGTIRTAARALDGQRCPTILLVDLSGIEDELAAMEALSHVCEPHVRVIVVGERNDVGLYRRLKELGIAEYLYRPLTRSLTESALLTALGRQSRTGAGAGVDGARLGKLVCVAGARGGTGTSTLAVNIAAYLAQVQRRRVALVDYDIAAGSTALLLNAEPTAALREVLENTERLDAKFLERAVVRIGERLDLLGVDNERPKDGGIDPRACVLVLDRVRSLYHYTVADIPAGLAAASPEILHSASIALIVFDGALASARDAARRLREAELAGVDSRLLLNRAGAPGQISTTDMERILGRQPDFRIPYLPKPFADAMAIGVPVIERNRRAKAMIGRIVQELSGQAAPQRSFLDRVFKR